MTREKVFSDIYQVMLAGKYESVSGHGSTYVETANIRHLLPPVLKSLEVHTILDAPCGDFNWMRHLDYHFDNYIGIDIVPEIIINHTLPHDGESRHFMIGDIIVDPLPAVDLVLCRDCLVHLTLEEGRWALDNIISSGPRYVAFTTYPHLPSNSDCATGEWRPLNMQLPPFSLWEPIVTLYEGGVGADEGKALAIWRVEP